MSLSIIEINDKKLWEKFIASRPEANFLQSWAFGEFHKSLNKHIVRLGLFDEAVVIGVALAVVEKAKRGTYLTVVGGPIIDHANRNEMGFFINALKTQAKKYGCMFIRIRPQLVNSPENEQLLVKMGMVESPMHLTADITVKLNLTKSVEELLAAMRKSTRYDVKSVEKRGVIVRESIDPEDIRLFYDRQLFLAKKHGFVPFGYQFLSKQFEALLSDGLVKLFHSFSKEGNPLASAFVIFYNSEASYHYGVSTEANAKLPGSYAVVWAAILEAKKRGMKTFNLWGIAPAGAKEHRFAGVTTFKLGFGGDVVTYVPAQDLPLSWTYWITRGFELVKKR